MSQTIRNRQLGFNLDIDLASLGANRHYGNEFHFVQKLFSTIFVDLTLSFLIFVEYKMLFLETQMFNFN